jgi:hypothetical protein
MCPDVMVVGSSAPLRTQLVGDLGRWLDMRVVDGGSSAEHIGELRPRVLLLDLSMLADAEIAAIFDAAVGSRSRIVALSSVPDAVMERKVREAGGVFALKVASRGRLTEAIQNAARAERPN